MRSGPNRGRKRHANQIGLEQQRSGLKIQRNLVKAIMLGMEAHGTDLLEILMSLLPLGNSLSRQL